MRCINTETDLRELVWSFVLQCETEAHVLARCLLIKTWSFMSLRKYLHRLPPFFCISTKDSCIYTHDYLIVGLQCYSSTRSTLFFPACSWHRDIAIQVWCKATWTWGMHAFTGVCQTYWAGWWCQWDRGQPRESGRRRAVCSSLREGCHRKWGCMNDMSMTHKKCISEQH